MSDDRWVLTHDKKFLIGVVTVRNNKEDSEMVEMRWWSMHSLGSCNAHF